MTAFAGPVGLMRISRELSTALRSSSGARGRRTSCCRSRGSAGLRRKRRRSRFRSKCSSTCRRKLACACWASTTRCGPADRRRGVVLQTLGAGRACDGVLAVVIALERAARIHDGPRARDAVRRAGETCGRRRGTGAETFEVDPRVVRNAGEAPVVTLLTTCGAAVPLLLPKPPEPVKEAVMVWLPTESVEVEKCGLAAGVDGDVRSESGCAFGERDRAGRRAAVS